MKQLLLVATVAAICFISAAQTPPSTPESKKEERKEAKAEKHKEREQKAAAYERFIDSLILSQYYAFVPSSFNMEPAGRTRQIINPMFRIDIGPGLVDICIPYFKGITPPYAITVINYTVPNPTAYTALQTDYGWKITFKTNLYTANNYTFEFNVYKKTGEMTLDLKSDIYNTVTYSGSLVAR